MKINILDEKTANIIAAGEVIERPASVVKELVENAIDAHSTKIKIELKESGISQIKITDNGEGFEKDDAKIAFFRHATSKIKTQYDLFKLRTLGFRGEALASIASVSETILITSTDGLKGYYYKYKASKLIEEKEYASNKGSTLIVNNLFYNTPVRRKYLKTLYVELSYIVDYVSKLALSNPKISFELINDNKVLINTNNDDNILNLIGNLYGLEIAKNILYFDEEIEGINLKGYMSNININRSKKDYITIICNNRYVKNYQIVNTISEAYKSFIPINKYPFFLLYIDIDPTLIDVNIHPQKLEIKISKEKEINNYLSKLIYTQLSKTNLIPNYNKIEEETGINKNNIKLNEIFDYNEIKEVIKKDLNNNLEEENSNYSSLSNNEENKEFNSKFDEGLNSIKDNYLNNDKNINNKKIPYLEYIGQYAGTYLLFQNEEGLYLIDQHAAQERINYEYYYEKLALEKGSKKLLIPYNLELTIKDAIYIKENIDKFKEINLILEPSGINSYFIREVPIWLKDDDIEDVITNLMYFLINEKEFDLRKIRKELAALVSCKKSIKANHYVNKDEALKLIEDLNKCLNPYTCPHGRPTLIKLTLYDIEKLFKRVI